MQIKGIKYIALLPPEGYGVAAKRLILALAETGIPITFKPLVPGGSWDLYFEKYQGASLLDKDLEPLCNKKIDYDWVIIHTTPEFYPNCVKEEQGKKIIAHTVWETDKIPSSWHNYFQGINRIIVPCQWNKDVFIHSGITKPIDILPHICLETEPNRNGLASSGQTSYVFYTIGVWSSRKAISDVIRAYLKAFKKEDDVLLIVKTNERDLTKQMLGKFRIKTRQTIKALQLCYPFSAKIKLITDKISDEEIIDLHINSDCYISLSHGEGWGLGAFDAATLGNPVIMTRFGGPLAFLQPELSYLVNYSIVPANAKGHEKYIFTADQNWCAPDSKHAVELMRQVYENQTPAKEKAIKLQQQIKEKFSAEAVVQQLLAILSRN